MISNGGSSSEGKNDTIVNSTSVKVPFLALVFFELMNKMCGDRVSKLDDLYKKCGIEQNEVQECLLQLEKDELLKTYFSLIFNNDKIKPGNLLDGLHERFKEIVGKRMKVLHAQAKNVIEKENGEIKKITNNLIEKAISTNNFESLIYVLTSVLYFKANWLVKFKDCEDVKSFYIGDKEIKDVNFFEFKTINEEVEGDKKILVFVNKDSNFIAIRVPYKKNVSKESEKSEESNKYCYFLKFGEIKEQINTKESYTKLKITHIEIKFEDSKMTKEISAQEKENIFYEFLNEIGKYEIANEDEQKYYFEIECNSTGNNIILPELNIDSKIEDKNKLAECYGVTIGDIVWDNFLKSGPSFDDAISEFNQQVKMKIDKNGTELAASMQERTLEGNSLKNFHLNFVGDRNLFVALCADVNIKSKEKTIPIVTADINDEKFLVKK